MPHNLILNAFEMSRSVMGQSQRAERGHSCPQQHSSTSAARIYYAFPRNTWLRTGMSALRQLPAAVTDPLRRSKDFQPTKGHAPRHGFCRSYWWLLNLLLATSAFHCHAASTSALNWSWAFAGDAQTLAVVNGVAGTADGSGLVAGTFGRDVLFGNFRLTAPDPNHTWQGFAAKVNSAGNPSWAVSMTATNGIVPLAVASDGTGGCFVAGGFLGNAVLGSFSLSGADQDVSFVAHLSASGAFTWAKSFSASTGCDVTSCSLASGGGVFLGGTFSGQVDFGIKSLTAQPSGAVNGFLARLDSLGNVTWAHRTGGEVLSVAVSPAGMAYAAGDFDGPSAVFENQTITNTAAEGRYVARFLADGTPNWIQYFTSAATPGSNTAAVVAAAGDETVWLAGTFTGSNTIGGRSFTNAGSADVAFVKYSNSGAVLAANSFGGVGGDVVHGAAIYSSSTYGSNNLVLVGSFEQHLSVGTNSLTADGTSGVSAFVALFDTNGLPLLLTGPTNNTETVFALAVGVNPGGIIVGGQLESYATFGDLLIGATTPGLYEVVNYFLAKFAEVAVDRRFPGDRPSSRGNLMVVSTPTEAAGQWRFPWDLGWRNSGQVVSNLPAGNYPTPANYPIQFRNTSGYLAIPDSVTVTVTNGGTTSVTNQYYPTLPSGGASGNGSLTVNIWPSSPAGAGWRFLGEITWRTPGSTAADLPPDTYFLEFEPASGYAKPASRAAQVYAGLTTVVSATYLLAQSAPGGVSLPQPVPTNSIIDATNYPFAFNGQLQSDAGYGSGVAVQQNVVLTAAHLLFNDQTLAYVNQVYWYFQREAGVFEPQPLLARGWYILSGYAAQRTNDLQSGLYGPDQSTPQSRNFDVAALYFLSPVTLGGYGGYLSSDTSPNPWLTGTSQKMLVGYPVDGSLFGDATITPGVMYQTGPQPYSFTMATDPVTNQQVYKGTRLLSYPGNSGGPLYVQFNGYYYPAAVYLGTLYNGVQPYASAVRAIDSNVVNMITMAATLGDSGTNNTGGGVITIIAGAGISASHPGYVQLQLAPPVAVQAGAAWRLQGDTTYSTATNYTEAVNSTNPVVVQFKPIAGWNLPTNQAVIVLPQQITTYTAFYTVTNPVMVINRGVGVGITGTTGTKYRLERRPSLSSGTWLPVKTNTLTNGFNLLLPWPLTNGPASFYRAVWLP